MDTQSIQRGADLQSYTCYRMIRRIVNIYMNQYKEPVERNNYNVDNHYVPILGHLFFIHLNLSLSKRWMMIVINI